MSRRVQETNQIGFVSNWKKKKNRKEKEEEEGRKIKRIASFDEFVEFRVSIFEISTNSPDGMETTIRKG